MNTTGDSPEYREWSDVAVRLFQGVVYLEDGRPWDVLLRNITPLEDYFGVIGLQLIVDESEGFAFLRQRPTEELPEGYDTLPKLFRRSRLSYDATLLTILLREELRRFEEEEIHDQRCVISGDDLFEQWKAFFPRDSDEVKLRKALGTAIRTLESLRFVRRFGNETDDWEVRRILKAKLIAADLEAVKQQFEDAFKRRGRGEE
ncbi:MAG: DUF4194 domain-containing protein [Planctomycetaceae bacterium]